MRAKSALEIFLTAKLLSPSRAFVLPIDIFRYRYCPATVNVHD
jgi:hypothetical protein